MKILVTGSNGFIGSSVLKKMYQDNNYEILGSVRSQANKISMKWPTIEVGDLSARTNWIAALDDVDVVIHAAARVHVMNDRSCDPLSEYRLANVEGSLKLARQAADCGVKRFIYISSIKVNGENNQINTPFKQSDLPNPKDSYAISKMESEQALLELSKTVDMEVVIIRPPLVYGPGVSANFLMLINLINKKVPLPFASIKNLRSLIGISNLVDVIIKCISHPAAAGKTYLVCDDEDVSTPELIRKIAYAFGIKPILISFPVSIIKLGGKLIGRSDKVERLIDTLVIDSSTLREDLCWHQPLSMQDELDAVAAWYKNFK